MDLKRMRGKRARLGIGLMSGTSCDGVDAALVAVWGTGPGVRAKLIAFESTPYAEGLRARLLARRLTSADMCELDEELGEKFADAAERMVAFARDHGRRVDFVASHGHTIAHFPPPDTKGTGTSQIGSANAIAWRTGLAVVSDFRPRDMAAGGQGAPLVPYADWVLFRDKARTVATLNIGGIANFTLVTPSLDSVMAFDTGPGNMFIDGAMRSMTNNAKGIDLDGACAAQGMVIPRLLNRLLDHPYYEKEPPKSTGREAFGLGEYLDDILAEWRTRRLEDVMATVTYAVARTIADAYRRFLEMHGPVWRLIVGGGGASNETLMALLRQELAELEIVPTDQYGVPSDAREAMAFAILGNETICGSPANVPGATGARHKVVLGKVTVIGSPLGESKASGAPSGR